VSGGVDVDAVVIRDAVAADVAAIVALLQQLSLDGAARERAADDPAYVDAFRAMDADPRTRLLVAVRAGVVVATAQLTILPNLSHGGRPVAQLESVVVDDAVRGAGVGGVLVDECLRLARASGCFRAQLTSNAARGDAHRFWAKHGFAPTHVGFKCPL
jgi:N-acetylglutamate synthase-like GNAT family acetyltransferase